MANNRRPNTRNAQESQKFNNLPKRTDSTKEMISSSQSISHGASRAARLSQRWIVHTRTIKLSRISKNNTGNRYLFSTVGGIAEQTHLLALNAAIEAGRAGEAGQLAIVTQEIRTLSTVLEDKDIAKIISDIPIKLKKVTP